MSLSLQQLSQILALEFEGDPELVLDDVASLVSATESCVCFIQERKYLAVVENSRCGAVILTPELAAEVSGKALLIADNPYYSFIRAIDALGLVATDNEAVVHPSAQIAKSARLGKNVSVCALAIIEDGAEIGDDAVIGNASIVGRDVRVGNRSRLYSRVTLEQGVQIGEDCILHSGVVVGADGFGVVMQDQRWHKIPQLGSVKIENDVEIGANTTIDRGALDDTVIETGCKLDNLIQIAHNVRIGAHTAIAACVGIAGSATIGRHCKISGAAVVLGHLEITDHVTVTAMSLVTKDIKKPGVYSSGTPLMENSQWHRSNARYKALEKIAKSVARLEKSKT